MQKWNKRKKMGFAFAGFGRLFWLTIYLEITI